MKSPCQYGHYASWTNVTYLHKDSSQQYLPKQQVLTCQITKCKQIKTVRIIHLSTSFFIRPEEKTPNSIQNGLALTSVTMSSIRFSEEGLRNSVVMPASCKMEALLCWRHGILSTIWPPFGKLRWTWTSSIFRKGTSIMDSNFVTVMSGWKCQFHRSKTNDNWYLIFATHDNLYHQPIWAATHTLGERICVYVCCNKHSHNSHHDHVALRSLPSFSTSLWIPLADIQGWNRNMAHHSASLWFYIYNAFPGYESWVLPSSIAFRLCWGS